MASTTVKPYPHIQMNVKDNSIATINMVETLPVHRPLYVMKTQKGPIGRPVWCNTYSEAAAIFGAETFNPANKDYYTKASAFLKETLTNNGAFISRYLPVDYNKTYAAGEVKGIKAGTQKPEKIILNEATANVLLYAEVKETDVPQYEIDETTGLRKQEWNKDLQEWVDKVQRDPYDAIVTEKGVQVVFKFRKITNNDYVDPTDPSAGIKMDKDLESGIFPILALTATDPGAYGNDLGVSLFYTPKSNDVSDVGSYKTLFYNIGFFAREYNSTTWDAIVDIYNRENMAFAANPDTINPDTGASMAIDNVLDKGFSDSLHQLPVNFEISEKNLNYIGLIIASYEKDYLELDENGNPYDDPYTPYIVEGNHAASLNGYGYAEVGFLTEADKTAIQKWFKGEDGAKDPTELDKATGTYPISDPTFGYKVNAISGKNLLNVEYDHTMVGVEFDADTGEVVTVEGVGVTNLNAATVTPLAGGDDGVYIDDEENKNALTGENQWASNDQAMYRFVKLKAAGVRDEIVESLHYPFTHIFDLGYSFKTKKAMLDFLDVRDDVIVILSTQVLMADGSGRTIKQNDQATDEGNGEALRAYALLMRESVLYGTDCMRCSIYCHSGHIVDTTAYNGILPFTYWDAVQYSKYGNLTYMKQDEPRGLPNAYNLLFKDWNWWNYRADSQSRVWDNGLNYVQYADMTRLFYPSLRTVYRAATSVLVDEWFVAAVVYAKYVCRRAWATFSGRNDTASILQGAIKKYLDTELGHLFNGKYSFTVSVYQTAEEQELGYIQHVKLSITSGATMRVLDVDIEVNREGFIPEE